MKKTSTSKYKTALKVTTHSSRFIDNYVAFLENQGKRFTDLPAYRTSTLVEFKTQEYFRIADIKKTMIPPISDSELLETMRIYIRLHNTAALTKSFIYPTPSEFYKHYHEIVNSKEFNKDVENIDVRHSLSDTKIQEQIAFILDRLTIAWSDKIPYEDRVRLLARSFANYDKFCLTEEFQKLPESIQSQFSRFQVVRNFYRFVEQSSPTSVIRKSPVMTLDYLHSIVKQQIRHSYRESDR
jgi:hypothetical protein